MFKFCRQKKVSFSATRERENSRSDSIGTKTILLCVRGGGDFLFFYFFEGLFTRTKGVWRKWDIGTKFGEIIVEILVHLITNSDCCFYSWYHFISVAKKARANYAHPKVITIEAILAAKNCHFCTSFSI